MDVIRFEVPAVPVPQPRARAVAFKGHARMYEAPKSHAVHAFKASVREAANRVYNGAPLRGNLEVSILFVLPRPQAMVWKSRPMPRAPHTKKPDLDNLCKSPVDALLGRLWADDAIISTLHATKCIASGDEQPHVEIEVTVLS